MAGGRRAGSDGGKGSGTGGKGTGTQGCTSAADKMTALMHMVRLECGDCFHQYCESVISCVSDQGVPALLFVFLGECVVVQSEFGM